MARRKKSGGAGCSAACKTTKGRLKKGCKWRKGRKGCAVPARARKTTTKRRKSSKRRRK